MEQKAKKEKIKNIKTPATTYGVTMLKKTGCGKMYTTLNEDPEDGELCHVMAQLGKSGSCPKSFLEGLTGVIDLALGGGIDPDSIVLKLKGIRCPQPNVSDGEEIHSCCDGVALCLEEYLKKKKAKEREESKKAEEKEEKTQDTKEFKEGVKKADEKVDRKEEK